MPVAVGTFTTPTSVGSPQLVQSISGLAFQPKAIILVAAGKTTTLGTAALDNIMMYGMASGSADTAQQCMCWGDNDGYFAQNCGGGLEQSAIYLLNIGNSGAAAVLVNAKVSSFDSDGVTFDYIQSAGTAYQIGYIAIGGDNVTAELVQFQSITTIATQEVNLAGAFQPDAIIIQALSRDSFGVYEGDVYASVGVATSTSDEHCISYWCDDGGSASTAEAYMASTRIIFEGRNAGIMDCSLSSIDTDGFTLDHIRAANGTYRFAALCLQGIDAAIADLTVPGSVSPSVASTSGLGFQPEVGIHFSQGAGYGARLDANWMIGAVTDTSNRWVALGDSDDGAGSMICENNMFNDRAIARFTATSSSVTYSADISSVDSGGMTFDFDDVGGGTEKVFGLYLAGTGGGSTTNTLTTSIQSAIQAQQTLQASLNSAVSAEQTAQLSIDGAVAALLSAVSDLNGAIQTQDQTLSAQISAALQTNDQTVVSQISAALERQGITDTTQISTAIQAENTSATNVDGYVTALQNVLVSINAAVSALQSGVFSVDAALQETGTVTTSINGAVAALQSSTADLQAAIAAAQSATVALNGFIQASATAETVTLDGAVSEAKTLVASLNGVVQAAQSVSFDLNAFVSIANSVTTDISGYITAPQAVIALLEAAIQAAASATATIDAGIAAEQSAQVAVSTAIAVLQTLQTAVDVVIASTGTVVLSIGAAVEASITAGISVNARIFVLGEFEPGASRTHSPTIARNRRNTLSARNRRH